jgi:hypothetical protein
MRDELVAATKAEGSLIVVHPCSNDQYINPHATSTHATDHQPSISLSQYLPLSSLLRECLLLLDLRLQVAMAASRSSSAGGAMRASLVLVLLLAAVASAHAGRAVSCENKCGKSVWMNGKECPAGKTVVLDLGVEVDVALVVKDKDGKDCTQKFVLPLDVTAVVVLYDGVFLKVKVKAVSLLFGLLHTLLGFICVNLRITL